jgi:hypothetical protein
MNNFRNSISEMLTVFLLILGGCAFAAFADSKESPGVSAADAKVLRVGGNYVVASVDLKNDSSFLIVFKSVQPTGKFDFLRLESDHVHVAVKVGQTLRLSAEVLSSKNATADVSQVVLFLPHAQGPVPVWLMSNRVPPHDLNASKYLEMHSPVSDYTIM